MKACCRLSKNFGYKRCEANWLHYIRFNSLLPQKSRTTVQARCISDRQAILQATNSAKSHFQLGWVRVSALNEVWFPKEININLDSQSQRRERKQGVRQDHWWGLVVPLAPPNHKLKSLLTNTHNKPKKQLQRSSVQRQAKEIFSI